MLMLAMLFRGMNNLRLDAERRLIALFDEGFILVMTNWRVIWFLIMGG